MGFFGEVKDGKWVPGEEVWAEAYDVPIPGYATKVCLCVFLGGGGSAERCSLVRPPLAAAHPPTRPPTHPPLLQTTSNLRLWNALAVEEFDIDSFNVGNFADVRRRGGWRAGGGSTPPHPTRGERPRATRTPTRNHTPTAPAGHRGQAQG